MSNKRSLAEQSSRQNSDKNSDRRTEILEAAGQLFSSQGFHATSMRDLAKAVKLQGGSLYAHIDSKEELLFELVNLAADQFLSSAEAVPATLAPKERLERLIAGHLEVIVREIDNATVFFHEWKFLNPNLQKQITERRDAYESHFRQTLEAGVKSGDFQIADLRITTLFVLSALNWTYHWYRPSGKLTLAALSRQYRDLVFKTLGATEE